MKSKRSGDGCPVWLQSRPSILKCAQILDNLCCLTQSILYQAKTAKFFLYPQLIIIVYVIDDVLL